MTFSDLLKGESVTIDGLITDINERTAKNGSPYLDITVSKGLDSISGKLWSSERFANAFPDVYRTITEERGVVIRIDGRVDEFQGKKQIIIERLRLAPQADPEDFMPSSPFPREDMVAELKDIVVTVSDDGIRTLLELIFRGDMLEAFSRAPAAKSFHHNYLSGLIEHTLQICRLADSVIKSYPPEALDRDVLIAGILTHDLGKITEYENNSGKIDVTDEGRRLGHITIGAEMVSAAAEACGLDKTTAAKIKHIILSHHGQREFGAAVLPMTIEAFMVHMLDNIDAKMKRYGDIVRENPGLSWSPRQRMFNDMEMFLD